jgi:hypothetical protein
VDLLSVVAHELGHVLGLDDFSGAAGTTDVMGDGLAPGVRRVPSVADVAALGVPTTLPTAYSPGVVLTVGMRATPSGHSPTAALDSVFASLPGAASDVFSLQSRNVPQYQLPAAASTGYALATTASASAPCPLAETEAQAFRHLQRASALSGGGPAAHKNAVNVLFSLLGSGDDAKLFEIEWE